MHYFPDDNNPTRALQGDGEYWLVVGWVVVDIGCITISIGHYQVTIIINNIE